MNVFAGQTYMADEMGIPQGGFTFIDNPPDGTLGIALLRNGDKSPAAFLLTEYRYPCALHGMQSRIVLIGGILTIQIGLKGNT